ncbi:TrmB family transcriptional regulator [Phaeacidiphilus oryzae]|jgi:predicted DNA-binding transcriptional regulator|uniref:TrmB family transcriptional regulator n=1 Tax=Phaeacidiphilus oryzae TaxID=348818 RepID=UPI0005689C2E|nr:helix-turn-helix domain-containing protein [Phaeacidiphilus oryzae]
MQTDDRRAAELEELGLTNYEARVYLALIRRDVYTAAEVAREARVPRQRVYDVLDGLTRRQLAVLHPGRVAGYSAVAPEIAMDRLVEQQRRSLSRLERLSGDLARELLPTWNSGRTHTDPLDYVEVLRDRETINERFAKLQQEAEREILTFTRPPYFGDPDENEAGVDATARVAAGGGTVRSLYTPEALEDAGMREHIRRFQQAGEDARVAGELPLKLVIVDGSLVLCDMPDPVAGTGATTSLVIRHPSLAETLRLAFQSVWDSARPIPEVEAEQALAAEAD